MNNSNDTLKVVGALVIGATVGATLGILFAPKKGSETRQDIADGAEKFTKNLKNKVNDHYRMIEDVTNEFEEYADERMTDIKNNLDHQKDHFEGAVKS